MELTRAAKPSNDPFSTTDKIPNAFEIPVLDKCISFEMVVLYNSKSLRCFST